MTLPQNVKDAVGRVDRSLREWRICQQPWQIIRAHLLSQAAELKILRVKCSGTLANNLCPDHRDKQVGNPCLACTIEKLQSGLAAANERLEAAERDAAELRMCKGEYAMPDGTIAKCHVNVGVNVWHGERWLAFHECSPDQLRLIIDDAAQEGEG